MNVKQQKCANLALRVIQPTQVEVIGNVCIWVFALSEIFIHEQVSECKLHNVWAARIRNPLSFIPCLQLL